jgi:hypothetical protein
MSLSESAAESTGGPKRIDVREHLDPALDAFIQRLRVVLPTRFAELLGDEWRKGFWRLSRRLKKLDQLSLDRDRFMEAWKRKKVPLDFGHLVVLFEILEVAQLKVAAGLDLISVSQKFDVIRQVRNAHAHFQPVLVEDVTTVYGVMQELNAKMGLQLDDDLNRFATRFDRMLQAAELKEVGVKPEDIVDVSGRLHALPLEQAYAGAVLTSDQEKVIHSLKEFLADPDQDVFLLKGYAGTGKTFLMKGLVQHLLVERGLGSLGLVAPTGRAAKVLTDAVLSDDDEMLDAGAAQTLHRFVYSGSKLIEMTRDKEDTETPVLVMQINKDPLPVNFVCIVDEASMVSDVLSEHENFRFGSGRLLHDLFARLKVGTYEGAKVIMVGDPGQLPPVGMSGTPALDAEYIRETYGHGSSSGMLTEVIRQKADSGVLRLATELRSALDQDQMDSFPQWQTLPSDLKLIEEGWKEAFFKGGVSAIKNKVLLVHSNKRATELNAEIREQLYPGSTDLETGDLLMVIRNNYLEPELMNGELIEVVEATDLTQKRSYRIKTKREGVTHENEVVLKFRWVKIRGREWKPGRYAEKWLLENVLHSESAQLASEEHKALYVDFKVRHPDLSPKSLDFAKALQKDPFYNALQVKFGYAITVHKSQGGEWPEVFVDFDRPGGRANSQYFRWAYTAATRSSERMYMMSSPFFQGKQVASGRTATLDEKHVQVPMKYKSALPFSNMPTSHHELIGGALAWVFDAIGGRLDQLKAEQYAITASATWEGKPYSFTVWFKGDGRPSTHNYLGQDGDPVYEGLNRLAKKVLSWERETISGEPLKPIATGRGAFKCNRPDLLDGLRDRFGPSVTIRLEDSEDYCENVVITSPEGEPCLWKFYFKGNGKSGRNLVHPKSTANLDWIDHITQCLND